MIYEVYVNSRTGGQFGSIWDGIIGGAVSSGVQVGIPLLAGLLSGGGGTSSGGQARGLAAIDAAGQQVIQALQAILAAAGQAPAQQAVSDAHNLVSSLSNSTYFYQAQHGDDAAALANFKSQATSLLQQIETAYGAADVLPGTTASPGTAIVPAGNSPGTVLPTSTAAAQTIAGIPMSTLILVLGVGLGAWVLLK